MVVTGDPPPALVLHSTRHLIGWQGAPQIVLLAVFVVALAAVLIAAGRASLARE